MNKVPNLRFNNFNDEWQEHVLGDIFEFYTTNSFSRDFLDNDNGSVKNIHYGDIHMKFPTLLDVKNTQIPYVKETVDLSKISIESYCKNGDVVIADASEDYNDIGKAIELQSIGEEKVIAGLHTILARDNKGIMVNGFRGYLMTSPNVRKQIKVYAAGAKVLGISKANISKVNLLIPSSMEQEKIASFFSLIDKKIELQTEKVEELTNYKKGIMQKIFSQELRFKDENGNEYPEWKIGRLGEYLSNKGGTALEKYVEDEGTHNFISIGNYSVDGNYIDTGQRINLNDKTQEKLLNKNDLVMVLNDKTASGDLIGSTILIDEDNKYIYNQRSERLICNSAISPDFCWVLLNSKMFRKKVFSIAQGGTQIYVNFSSVKNLEIELPHLKEQEKIAHFIFNLNTKLNKEQEKLDMLLTYKKGLLQQMFI